MLVLFGRGGGFARVRLGRSVFIAHHAAARAAAIFHMLAHFHLRPVHRRDGGRCVFLLRCGMVMLRLIRALRMGIRLGVSRCRKRQKQSGASAESELAHA